jgi:hypothetical protein
VATIEPRYEESKPHISYNDKEVLHNRCIMLSIEMRPGNNVVDFGTEVEEIIKDYEATLTPDIHIHRITDQPQVVDRSVRSFLKDLIEAILVVIIVMLILFPLRTALVSSTSVPICIAATIGIMYFIGFELNTVTLAALSGIVAGATPMLVYNGTDDDQTVILMRTTDAATANNVDIYTGFKGTLVASTIAASTNDQTNYALNGKQFVWVKNALSIAANKCWLEVVNSNARAISILFTGETTGIATATRTEATGDLYDLNGRKVLNPTRKGIYIQNGKKVVVK